MKEKLQQKYKESLKRPRNNECKFNNLEEMHKFLEARNLPRLIQEERATLNRLITSSENEAVITTEKPSRQIKCSVRWLSR